MKTKLLQFLTWVGINVFILVMLVGCGYQRPDGQWAPINAPGVYFSGVELSDDARDAVYPELCAEARQEIETELLQRLPERIAPLTFHIPQNQPLNNPQDAVFHMSITNCAVEVQHWDMGVGGFSLTFYLALTVRVTLKLNGHTLLGYSMKTLEKSDTNIPSPLSRFTFEEPVSRTLLLFDEGRVWIPKDNQVMK